MESLLHNFRFLQQAEQAVPAKADGQSRGVTVEFWEAPYHGKQVWKEVLLVNQGPESRVRGNNGTTFLQRRNEPPGIGKLIADNLGGVLGAGVEHDEDFPVGTAAVEGTKAPLTGVHVLNWRMDFQHSGPEFRATVELLHGVAPFGVDGNARNEQLRKASHDSEQVVIRYEKRSISVLGEPAGVVAAILSQQDRLLNGGGAQHRHQMLNIVLIHVAVLLQVHQALEKRVGDVPALLF